MTRVIVTFSLVAMTALLLSASGEAQDKTEAEKVPKTEEVVVTATKTPTPVAETGSSVTVITREEIERRQATDAMQILREQPGTSGIQTGSRGALQGQLFIRGGNADMNLVLIDGMKINQGGGSADFRDITMTGIRRVEIVRGPQSALYGADAFTSVIQFFTPRGEGPFSAWAAAGAGNYDTTEERVGMSWGNARTGVFFEFDRIDTTGILDKNNEHRNHTGVLRLDASPDKDLEFTATGRFNQSRIEFPTENEGDRLQPILDPRQFNENERFVGTLGGRWKQSRWLEHRLKAGLNVEDRLTRDPRDVPPDPASRPPEGTRNNAHEHRMLLDYHATLLPPVFRGLTPTVVVGSSYDAQKLTQRNRPVTTRLTNADREAHAAYGQLQLGWIDHVFLTGGLRYDSSTVYGPEITPRVALAVIAPKTETRFRGAWGTGIKEPSFSAEFGGATFAGNRDIKPEHAESWEIGLDQPLFRGRFEVGTTYFHNRFDDLISFISSAEGFRNIQKAKTQGLETVLTLRPVAGWRATANYTLLDTEAMATAGVGGTAFVRGEPLLRRPQHAGAVSVGYERDRLNAVASLFVRGDSIDRDFSKGGSPRVALEGYNKLDVSVAYVVAKEWLGLKSVTWKTRVQNLLNETYEEVFGFSSPRLSFLTGFEARY